MMKVKRLIIIALALFILSLSLMFPVTAAEVEQSENTTSILSTVPAIEAPTTEPATVPDYSDVTQISKYGFVAVVGILSMIVGMMSAKAFSFWKW